MRILVIGSGAREHALLTGMKAPHNELQVVPGNAGMADLATLHKGVVDDQANMVALAQDIKPDLIVVGPEIPLVAGVSDALRHAGFLVFGPSQAAAQIEGSKAFAKDVMAEAGVRTAHAEVVPAGSTPEEIDAALDRFGPTWVVKDDGLAGGKGVVVTPNINEARAHLNAVQ